MRGTKGIVATGHPLASWVGAEILAKGGNAVDASVAVAATLAVVKPNQCGLGGDVFALLAGTRNGEITSLNGSGAAPLKASVEWYGGQGYAAIPETGILSVAVPGAVDAWCSLLERYGTMDLEELLRPAIRYAEEGFPISNVLAKAIAKDATLLSSCDAARQIFLQGGPTPRPGSILRQPALARTMQILARKGRDGFYKGEVADEIVEASRRQAGFISHHDLSEHRSSWGTPLQTEYRGCTVFTQPPVSQGVTLLEALNILAAFRVHEMAPGSPDLIHVQSSAFARAFDDKDRLLGDPTFVRPAAEILLSPDRARAHAAKITASPRIAQDLSGDVGMGGGDTTYFAIGDRDGNMVSLITSLFGSFGSGVVAGSTGVLLNNRLSCFDLNPEHPNVLAPGKRTVHTLHSYVVTRERRGFIAGGTPGGDGQAQTNIQVLGHLLDYGLDLQAAIEAPRWRVLRWPEIALEERFPEDVRRELRQLGYSVQVVDGWAHEMGGTQVIQLDLETGAYAGGADPRREGYVIAF